MERALRMRFCRLCVRWGSQSSMTTALASCVCVRVQNGRHALTYAPLGTRLWDGKIVVCDADGGDDLCFTECEEPASIVYWAEWLECAAGRRARKKNGPHKQQNGPQFVRHFCWRNWMGARLSRLVSRKSRTFPGHYLFLFMEKCFRLMRSTYCV